MFKNYLVTIDVPGELAPESLEGIIREYFEEDLEEEPITCKVGMLEQDDFIETADTKETPESVVLGRRRINLRKHKDSLQAGCKVRLKDMQGPDMLLEQIGDAPNKIDPLAKQIRVGQCCWFDGKALHRDGFILDQLEQVEYPVKSSPEQDMQFDGFSLNAIASGHPAFKNYVIQGAKLNAIKELRGITNTGLKESKDAVESITLQMIKNWKDGIF